MIICPAVRVSEEIDLEGLTAYLRRYLPARIAAFDPRAPIEVTEFPGGRSNLTYLLRLGELELVLRRPPPGPLAPTAHDMAREFRWLSALHPVFPLAPKPFLVCQDRDVIGATFYVMERRQGLVLQDDEPSRFADRPELRRLAGEAIVDTLVDLHGIDVTAEPLRSLGRPAGFLERQIQGWTERWQAAQTSPLAEMEMVAGWLRANLPPAPRTASIVHGDYKLDNVMLDAASPATLTAVLDWEMSALGDPLVDLGNLLTYWGPTAPPRPGPAQPITSRPGWPTRDQMIERYAARSGRDLTRLGFYEVFARFKVAVIVQQIFRRYTTGHTDDQRFAGFDTRVEYLAREAAARLG